MQIAMTLGLFPVAIHSVWLSSSEINTTWPVRPKKGPGQVINGLFAPMSSQITLTKKQQTLYFSPENYYFFWGGGKRSAAAVDSPDTAVTSPLPSCLSTHHNWHGVYIVLMIKPFPHRDEDGVHSVLFSQSRESWNAHVHASELSFLKFQVRFYTHVCTCTHTHAPQFCHCTNTSPGAYGSIWHLSAPSFLILSLGSFQWWRKIPKSTFYCLYIHLLKLLNPDSNKQGLCSGKQNVCGFTSFSWACGVCWQLARWSLFSSLWLFL